jgi:hypothetical protein
LRYKFPRTFRDADVGALPHALVQQIRLSLLLGCGFVFSLVPIGGLVALVAFAIGWRALAKINRSGGRLAGLWMA